MLLTLSVGESKKISANYNYQSFLPGESCESINKNDVKSHNSPGHYSITGSVYCGMNYTGSSCEDIHITFTETRNKSRYYHIKSNSTDYWTYCNMTISNATDGNLDFISTCAGVGGGWRKLLTLTSVQEMIVRVSG